MSDLPHINKDLEQLWADSDSRSHEDFREALETRAEKARSKKKIDRPIGKYFAGEQTRRWKNLASTPRLESAEGLDAYLRANPNFGVRPAKLPEGMDDEPWKVNCVRCVSASELGRRGYDVTAGPGTFKVPVGSGKWNAQHALDVGWRNRETGRPPKFVEIRGNTKKSDNDLIKHFNTSSKPGDRGFLTNTWKTVNEMRKDRGLPPIPDSKYDERTSHIAVWEKKGNRIVIHDPQNSDVGQTPKRYLEDAKPGTVAMVKISDGDPIDRILGVVGGELEQWR